jgi:hypothetical protein
MPALCNLDFSVFVDPSTAFGNVTGNIELAAVPRIGEQISFLFPKNGVSPIILPGFQHALRVEGVIYNANSPVAATLISLETVVLTSASDAMLLFKFLEDGFGLFGSEY